MYLAVESRLDRKGWLAIAVVRRSGGECLHLGTCCRWALGEVARRRRLRLTETLGGAVAFFAGLLDALVHSPAFAGVVAFLCTVFM